MPKLKSHRGARKRFSVTGSGKVKRNKAFKIQLKTAIRATREAVVAGEKEKATAALRLAAKKIDKAASKGVIHKNQAANRKSAIAKRVDSLSA